MVGLNGFQRHVKSRYTVFAPPLSGKDTAAIIAELSKVPQADIDKLDELIKKYMK
jgi:hypothetical protein